MCSRRDEEEEVQHIQMGRLGRGLGVCLVLAAASAGGGSADGFFPRSQAVSGMARLCGAASGRQSEGGLRAAGCWLLAAGRAWWLLMLVVWQAGSSIRISGWLGLAGWRGRVLVEWSEQTF